MKPHKEYNRITKKYEKTTEQVGDLKKRDTCKGKREHDYCLTLPEYMIRYLTRDITPEAIIVYYETEEAVYDFEKKIAEKLEKYGIRQHRYSGTPSKYYVCSVCGKKKVEY